MHPENRDGVESITVLDVAFHYLLDREDDNSHIIIRIIQNARDEYVDSKAIVKGPNNKDVVASFFYRHRDNKLKFYYVHPRSKEDPNRVTDNIVVHGLGLAPVTAQGYVVGVFLPDKQCKDLINTLAGNPPPEETFSTR